MSKSYLGKLNNPEKRNWICPVCKTEHNRDYNASTNIVNEGKRLIGIRSPKFTLVDYPTMDDRLSNKALKSSDRLNQEILNV